MMWIEDNQRYSKTQFKQTYPQLSSYLLDQTLDQLDLEDKLLVFARRDADQALLDGQSKIFESFNQQVKTGNVIGFLGYGDEQLEIHTRFSQNDDFFLNYLLQKVMDFKLVNLESGLGLSDSYYDFMFYLFPRYLNQAMRKGIYREYRYFEHNDTHLKGTFKPARHLKENTPFMGKVAYTTRDYTVQTDLLYLIRHTLEYLKINKPVVYEYLLQSDESRANLSFILNQSQDFYRVSLDQSIQTNLKKPVNHAFYTEYRQLQLLCLLILQQEKHGLNSSPNKVYGILFDVAWLWEEYLYLILADLDFQHPQNKQRSDGVLLYQKMYGKHRNRTVYPDFYHPDGLVLDAKYKRADHGIQRNDLYQIITYSHILNAKTAGIIFPSLSQHQYDILGDLAGLGGQIFKLGFQIPQEAPNYAAFVQTMVASEKQVKNHLQNFLEQ